MGRPEGKKPTTRGNKLASDKAEAKAKALDEPCPTFDWGPAIAGLTDDPAKKAVLLRQMAALDEVELEMRTQVLAGSSTAGRVWIGVQQQRAKLLGLYAPPPAAPPPPPDPNQVDLVDWLPHVPEEVDDAELGRALLLEGEDADA